MQTKLSFLIAAFALVGAACAADAPAPVQSPAAQFLSAVAALCGNAYGGRIATNERQILEDMGHPQPPTPLFCDNEVAIGLVDRCRQP